MMKQNHLTWRMLSLSIVMGLMCLMGNNAEAQVVCNDTVFPFLETFDGGVDSLVCWQPLEGSNWQLIQPGTGSGNGPNKSMVSSSEYANVDSWIVSKAIALPADTTEPLVLSWDVSATHYLTYYYRYFVLVSTGDWTDRTSYDTVYADSSMQVYCGNENTNFENRMVNLDAYHGQVIHVAFCNHPLYADPYEGHWMRLNIDNVEVSCTYDTVDAPDTVWRTVSVTTDAPEACEVYGSGVYADSSTVEIGFLLADTVAEGGRWQFLGWSDGENDNPRTILVTSDTIIVALFEWMADSVGINELRDNSYEIRVYPNPAGNTVTIRTNDDSPLRMAVMDMNGRVVLECRQDTSVPIDVSQLPRGAYFVRITTDEGTTVKKLIVK